MAELKLDSLIDGFGLDTRHYWENDLPLFEQKLLVLARALIAEPKFLLLDRPGSSLDRDQTNWVLGLLRQHGITYMTFEKSGSDPERYDMLLELEAGGAWHVQPIQNSHAADLSPA